MSLRARVMSGLFWVGGTRLIGQILTWGITIVVIRLLTPGDYGLLAMATVFMGFLSLVAEAGLGPALTQAPEARRPDAAAHLRRGDRRQLRAVRAAVRAPRPWSRNSSTKSGWSLILRVLAIHFLLTIFTVVPGALLMRKLDFKRAVDDRIGGIDAGQPDVAGAGARRLRRMGARRRATSCRRRSRWSRSTWSPRICAGRNSRCRERAVSSWWAAQVTGGARPVFHLFASGCLHRWKDLRQGPAGLLFDIAASRVAAGAEDFVHRQSDRLPGVCRGAARCESGHRGTC